MTSEGVKLDKEKPWAGTVIAGHWPLLRGRTKELLGLAQWEVEVFDRLFETSVPYRTRLLNAAAKLAHGHHSEWLPLVVSVGHYGAMKPEYGPDNWLSLKDGSRRCYEAAGRHVQDWLGGASTDWESHCHQRGHIYWNVMSGAEHASRETADDTIATVLKAGTVVAYAKDTETAIGVTLTEQVLGYKPGTGTMAVTPEGKVWMGPTLGWVKQHDTTRP